MKQPEIYFALGAVVALVSCWLGARIMYRGQGGEGGVLVSDRQVEIPESAGEDDEVE